MAEVEESLLKRKLDSYSSKNEDFKAENELTVEITLNEYRELIKSNATKEADLKKANEAKYTREDENKKLKKENKELEMKLFEYRKLYGELEDKQDEVKEE